MLKSITVSGVRIILKIWIKKSNIQFDVNFTNQDTAEEPSLSRLFENTQIICWGDENLSKYVVLSASFHSPSPKSIQLTVVIICDDEFNTTKCNK